MLDHDYFKGKKVTVMGIDLEGRGIQDVEFLARHGAEVIATDQKTKEQLKDSLSKLGNLPGVTFVLGEHRLEDFRGRDLIVRASSAPLNSPYLIEAEKNGIQIDTDETLFLKLSPEIISIGITGTRGKTTTTHLIYELVKARYGDSKVFIAGNVRGKAALPLLENVKKGDFVVFELASWQLQAFGYSKISPHIAVFTNLMSDHLNYYGGSLERYFDDKSKIFLHQKQNDYLVTGEKVAHLITAKHFGKLWNDPISVGSDAVPKDWKLRLKGEHNLDNVALAIKVAKILNIPYEIIKDVVERFGGVAGRLEYIKSYKDADIYNDTTATTPDATIAGLKALSKDTKDSKVILIAGGTDKQLPLEELAKALPEYCKKVILLPGTGTDKLMMIADKSLGSFVIETKSLKEAVDEALNSAEAGDVILFSPGFASFGLFKNEYDRGDQFNALINGFN